MISAEGLSWRVDDAIIGIAILVAGDVFASWSSNHPSLFTYRSFATAGGNKASDAREDFGIGAAKTAGETVLLSVGATLLTRSYVPAVFAAAAFASNYAFGRWALEHPHPRQMGIANQ